MKQEYQCVTFEKKYFEKVLRFWAEFDNLSSDEESVISLEKFITRNPDLSFVLVYEEKIVGTIFCGHDGRRGFIYHLAIHSKHQAKGLGSLLLNKSVGALKEIGLAKIHILSLGNTNSHFWEKEGFALRENLTLRTKKIVF